MATEIRAIGPDNAVPLIEDPLAEALHFLRMDGMFYCRSELTAPWGLELPPMTDCLWFHVITSGSCILIDSDDVEHQLAEGDVVVMAHGAGHRALDIEGTPTPPVFDLPHDYISRQYAILRHGGGGQPTNIICGLVQFTHPAARALVENLPELIRVDAAAKGPEWQWLPGILSLLAAETRATRPGGEAVVTRLCDILVIQAIRTWIETDPLAKTGWLGALRDPAIGHAIARIHREPENDWTVASLAAECAMSRSGFAARFSELVGRSPMQYATEWRMHLASDLLRTEQLSIAAVASRFGYQSEAAFSRAFKRVTGIPPSSARLTPEPAPY
ncbi:MAG: AraC family transcriptional regulator [Acidimicrobiales bacterium]